MAGCLQGTRTSISTTGFGLRPSFLPWNHKPNRFHKGQTFCSEPETQNASLLGIQRGEFESLKNSLKVCSLAHAERYQPARATKLPTADWAVQPLSSKCPHSLKLQQMKKGFWSELPWKFVMSFGSGEGRDLFILIYTFWKCSQVCTLLAPG